MALPTRATLRTFARVRADQDASDFPTDAQYNMYLDDAAREVWWDLRAAGWPINFQSLSITASGLTFYPFSLAGQVSSIHGVYFVTGNEVYPMHRVNEGKRAVLQSGTTQSTGYAGFYDPRIDPVLGPGIELLPRPATGSYRVDYVLEHPGFASDTDVWYGPARSDSMIVLKAAYMGVRKEGQARAGEAAALMQEYAAMLAQVVAAASWFDLRSPQMIRDVTSEQNRFAFDYPVAGGGFGDY